MMSVIRNYLLSYPALVVALALLYIATGKLGLLLAVPPGYATFIWPPSGIALGMLILHGKRLWPGILIGSFALNCYIAGAYTPSAGIIMDKCLTAFFIAMGSTLQALIGRAIIKHFIGLPLRLTGIKQMVWLFILAGPLACLTAATAGTAALHFAGIIPLEGIPANWLAWWAGDMFGILVFLPVMLVAPGSRERLVWRDRSVQGLPVVAMLAIIMPLGLTFYAWKIASETAYQKSQTEFQALTNESEKALLHRIDSYENALLGGAGFFQGSSFVSHKEWRSYVDAIQLKNYFPGIEGIGFIEPVAEENLNVFLRDMREDIGGAFNIHPDTTDTPYYIINYIEPIDTNGPALGLNIAFEAHRREAAELARDNGKAAITKRIALVQDDQKTPGFLLLHPLYKKGLPTTNTKEKRTALRGWIYAPFIAKNFMKDLTQSQGRLINLRIYDGDKESADALIYGSEAASEATKATFKTSKTLEVMQQKWLVVWDSTPEYEHMAQTNSPLFIMVGGLLFTGMFGIFLIVVSMRRTETMEWVIGEHRYAMPLIIFAIMALGSYALYQMLEEKEFGYIKKIVQDEANKIELVLTTDTNSKLLALRRMAQRWGAADGTPYKLWQEDAFNYTHDLSGLRTLEWVDKTYYVRWAEPLKGNEKAIGLNIIFDDARKRALEGAADSSSPTLTPPLNLVQGYQAFIAYLPLKANGKFDGFLAGVFAIDDFFGASISKELSDKYALTISYEGKDYFTKNTSLAASQSRWSVQKSLRIYDKEWGIRITPTKNYIASEKTSLPTIALIAGLMISALSALSVNFLLISRLKSNYLERSNQEISATSKALRTSEETFRNAIESASIGMALVEPSGRWLKVNKALCDILGYDEPELLRNDFQSITHPDDLEMDLNNVRSMIAGEISTYQLEKRYYHKSGRIIWALLSVSLVRHDEGTPNYFISQIQDITEQKEMAQMKSEFISIVSHELRTPLTSIRGSLGLIMGAMIKDIPEKAVKLIDIAHKNSERLILLINDILDIEKIGAGQMLFDMKEEAVFPLLQQAVETNQPYGDKYGITMMMLPVHDPDMRIMVDAPRLLQVLANLLSNAAKFSHAGGKVEVRASSPPNKVRIEVKDYGQGIAVEFRARIFGKFSQEDSSATRMKGGTGLGLHISKQMVEQMGGAIGFDTKVGEGTTFWIEFPRVASNEAQVSAEPPPIEDSTPILICEDSRDVALIMQMMVEKFGLYAEVAGTLAQARQMLAEKTYAALTLDTKLPDGDGLTLLNEIRGNPALKDLPVVMVSGNELSERPDIDRAKLNISAWLTKPLVGDQLARTIQQAIHVKEDLPRILHIEDDADLSHMIAASMQGKAEIITATTLKKAELLLNTMSFDMVILDIGMPDGSGLMILERYRLSVPILILSADYVTAEDKKKVAAVMVKSRMSETEILKTILEFLEKDAGADQ